MNMKHKKLVSVVVQVLVYCTVATYANRAVMNPLHPIDMQYPEDIPVSSLKAEARTPLSTSEVMELLADDEMRSQSNSSSKNNGQLPEAPRMDCSKITMQIFQVLLQNPDSVEPEDYSCGLLNLISHLEKSNGRIRALEASLNTATSTIKTMESSLQSEMSKTQFLMKELNETVHKETERAIKAENVIARRVLSEKSRVDGIQKNLTEVLGVSMDQLKELELTLKELEKASASLAPAEKANTSPYHPAMALLAPPAPVSTVKEEDIQKIEVKLSSLQQFIQDLSNRISHMEDGSEANVNKGIAQIFKTYASLANEIEKETDRAKGEETSLKTLITDEIAGLAKQISTIQDRITEEKNRVQIIENRKTADLFEEINRAKSEEARLAQKLKEEMSKAAAAFKRLELHVDTQFNSTKGLDSECKLIAENATKRIIETEEKLTEQINLERSRALSVENTIKVHVDAEMQRALVAENELKTLYTEEKERILNVEQELKAAIDVEVYRAKGVEFSISAQVTAESERAKQEEYQLQEHINANMTRLLTDIIKEFTRAQNAEMELSEKIGHETNRATMAEQNIMETINAEQTRASEKEQELYNIIKAQEDSTRVIDQVRNMIEVETSRAQRAEIGLENQIQTEVTRAKDKEDKISSSVNEELSKFKILERNLTQASSEVVRHTRELELEVRKTVMAEVARAVDAENSLKQQIIAEADRARGAELALSLSQARNYSDISVRMQDVLKEVEKDSLRLEDISLQISRNLTGDILTLAELFDDKLDDLERSENVRLKKIEEDMKKCCSSSSWRWRNSKGKAVSGGSTAGAVINKIMQVFGGANEEEDGVVPPPTAKKDTGKAGSRKKDSSKGRAFDDSQDFSLNDTDDDLKEAPTVEVEKIKIKNDTASQTTKVNTTSSENIENVVYVHAQKVIENEEAGEETLEKVQRRRRPLRNSRRDVTRSSSGRIKDSLVSVQSANSKVTSRFG